MSMTSHIPDIHPVLPYQPARSFGARLSRRLTPLRQTRPLEFKLERPLVSLSFDDCPLSVLQSALPIMERYDWQATLYIASGLMGTTNHLGLHMSDADVQAAYSAGHEIGAHSFAHQDLTQLTPQALAADLDKNAAHLDRLNVGPAHHFAYPYGETSPRLKQVLQTRYASLRGIQAGVHREQADLNQLRSQRLFSHDRLPQTLNTIEALAERPAWLTLFTHDVREAPSAWGCTPQDFKRVISRIKDVGADVMPVGRAVSFLYGDAI